MAVVVRNHSTLLRQFDFKLFSDVLGEWISLLGSLNASPFLLKRFVGIRLLLLLLKWRRCLVNSCVRRCTTRVRHLIRSHRHKIKLLLQWRQVRLLNSYTIDFLILLDIRRRIVLSWHWWKRWRCYWANRMIERSWWYRFGLWRWEYIVQCWPIELDRSYVGGTVYWLGGGKVCYRVFWYFVYCIY